MVSETAGTNVVAIVQARMGSTRLPGKVLLPLEDHPVLWHVIDRVRRATTLNAVAVATTTESADDAVAELCASLSVDCFRGSTDDVLDRYVGAAELLAADVVVRITADCPVIDPEVVDSVVSGFHAGQYDLYSLAGEYPNGLDCAVFRRSALETAWREATLRSDREHVGPYIRRNPHRFSIGRHELFDGLGHMRWTLDEPRDYDLLRAIYARLYVPGNPPFLTADILRLFEREPALMDINAGIVRNEGYLRSLANDARLTPPAHTSIE